MLVALASLLVPAMVEIVEIDGNYTDEIIIVNQTCQVLVKRKDRMHNYPKVEEMVFKQCFGEEPVDRP